MLPHRRWCSGRRRAALPNALCCGATPRFRTGAAAVRASLAASAFHFPFKASVKCNTKNQDGSHHLFDSGRSHRPFHRENRSMVHPATQTDTNARPYQRTPTQKRPALPCGGGRPPKRFCSPPQIVRLQLEAGVRPFLLQKGRSSTFLGLQQSNPRRNFDLLRPLKMERDLRGVRLWALGPDKSGNSVLFSPKTELSARNARRGPGTRPEDFAEECSGLRKAEHFGPHSFSNPGPARQTNRSRAPSNRPSGPIPRQYPRP